MVNKSQTVAVVGAGIAGAACAHALMRAGHVVHVFEKSRGPGGRLATRRVEWVDRQGRAHTTRLDHGAVAMTARSEAFKCFLDQGVQAGDVSEWAPSLAPGSVALEDGRRLHVPLPNMPALCRRLLDGAVTHWSTAVDALHKGPFGWQVQAGGERNATRFDAVLLALPPAQASPLLSPHQSRWARHASVVPMQPCWTLMGVAQTSPPASGWEIARPPTGPLGWVLRNEARPGREPAAGQAHWVAHARASWSRRHLEQPAEWVLQQLQAALAEWLGQPVDWYHAVVHRWRYALPPTHRAATGELCWWDPALGLGVCGDFLGGAVVAGVEGAWQSAQSLCAAVLQSARAAAEVPGLLAAIDAAPYSDRRLVA